MMTETAIESQSNMSSITFTRTDEGLRVQTTLLAGLLDNPETVRLDVLVKNGNVGIRELQIEAATRSIELLQQFVDVSEKSAIDVQQV